jgi:RNA polymerase sigma factor (sigma-70 family)
LKARKPREREVPIDEESDWIEDPAPLPPAILGKKGTVAAVREAIEVLPVEFRETLVLRELEGLSYKEIAEVSGVPLGTVMSRLARARDQLSLILLERKQHETL